MSAGIATQGMAATALIADRDDRFRGIVRRAIEGLVRIVGEADSAESAVSLARQLEPDVILIDLDLPEDGGITVARRIKVEQPQVRVILLTGHGEEAYLEDTGKSGADALLPKRDVKLWAPTVLRRVAGGDLRPWRGRERRGH
jgi:DNA-binding NarL/FixJ family response regulator